MPAPSKPFTEVPDVDIDTGSIINETRMTEARDNDIHLEEWLGLDYLAAQNHDHDDVNSKAVEVFGRFSIAAEPEEEATIFVQLGTTFVTKLTFKFYVAVTATYTFHANYRIRSSGSLSNEEALARLNINSGAFLLAAVSRQSTSFAYVSASEQAGGTLSAGWHTCEVQITNEDNLKACSIQGVSITFGLS